MHNRQNFPSSNNLVVEILDKMRLSEFNLIARSQLVSNISDNVLHNSGESEMLRKLKDQCKDEIM